MLIPKTYHPNVSLSKLDGDDYLLVQTDTDLAETLENVAFPKLLRKTITGVVIRITNGDYDGVWVTEYGAYYDLSAIYHPLSYYRPVSWTKRNLPAYWLEDNPEYNKEN
jgi:hypothetical protein